MPCACACSTHVCYRLQGLYVTIDFHFEQNGLQNSAAALASEWRRLWADLISLPTYNTQLAGRVFPEIANEWDIFGCKWDTASGSERVLGQGTGCWGKEEVELGCCQVALKAPAS